MGKKDAKINILDISMRQVDIAPEELNLEPGLCEKIKQRKGEMIVPCQDEQWEI